MAYSNFTLRDVIQQFGLTLSDIPDLMGHVPPVEPGTLLKTVLPVFLPVAIAVDNEKARSECVIAPVLLAVRDQFQNRFAVFSGTDFPAEPAAGLNGRCDFLLSRSPNMHLIESPVVAIAEAKNSGLRDGLGQCVAGMVGASRFNAQVGEPPRPVYGAVTSGTEWLFLQLDGTNLRVDLRQYSLAELPRLVGIIAHIAGVA